MMPTIAERLYVSLFCVCVTAQCAFGAPIFQHAIHNTHNLNAIRRAYMAQTASFFGRPMLPMLSSGTSAVFGTGDNSMPVFPPEREEDRLGNSGTMNEETNDNVSNNFGTPDFGNNPSSVDSGTSSDNSVTDSAITEEVPDAVDTISEPPSTTQTRGAQTQMERAKQHFCTRQCRPGHAISGVCREYCSRNRAELID